MDSVLHAQRAIRGGGKKTWQAHLAALPSGTFVDHRGRPHLLWNGRLWPWAFAGYEDPVPSSAAAAEITVLTPQSIVRAFQSGFAPQVHASAQS